MRTLWRDITSAARSLIRRPGFSTVAGLTLALGIGANAAISSVLNAVVLQPLAYADPAALVRINETKADGTAGKVVSYPNAFDWRERSSSLRQVATYRESQATLLTRDGAERLPVGVVSHEFFPLLGVMLADGRPFRAEEDTPGNGDVLIVSHDFLQSRLGGATDVVGQTLHLNGRVREIVGVLPQGFEFPLADAPIDLWRPLAAEAHYLEQRGMHGAIALGRLADGVSLENARVELAAIAAALARDYPDTNEGRGATLVPLRDAIVGNARPTLLLLMGVVSLVLLIACANVANLMMVRGDGRRRELAVRTALGAQRRHIVQGTLAEGLVLALAGGGIGVLLAAWLTEVLQATLPLLEIPRLSEIALDGTVLAFTLGVSVVTAVVFSLVPALHTSRLDVNTVLKSGGRGAADGARRTRGALVVLEVAAALVLVVGAGLLVRSFIRILEVDPGFSTRNALTFRVLAPSENHTNDDAIADFYAAIARRLEALPGVESAGASTTVPLAGGSWRTSFYVPSRGESEGTDDGHPFRYYSSTPGYFRAMGIPLLRGHLFDEAARRGRPGAVVINATMARRHWPDGDPLGETITLGLNFGQPDEPTAFEIVGIVGDVRHSGLDVEVMSQIYVPYRQHTNNMMHFVVRTTNDPTALADAVRDEISALDPQAPIWSLDTLARHRSAATASRRSAMQLLAGFAALAVVLAGIGLYGVISVSVARRTRELGIRMSLGARGSDILRLVIGQGMAPAVLGVTIGIVGALGLTRLLEGLLFEVPANDPATFVAVAIFLMLVALLACATPAIRAVRVDPTVTLRCE